ncbi:MAG: KH domain-containing protein [Deltaproteobacteria bacterium]|nr:KH domain-containing protein [Deltaproteobacteria bacterium]
MTEGQEFRGRSTAEAAIAASEALGVTRSEVDFRVISEIGEGLDRVVVIQAKAKEGAKPRSDDDAGSSDGNRSEGRRERGGRERGGRDRGGRDRDRDRGGRGGRDRGDRDNSGGRGRRDGRQEEKVEELIELKPATPEELEAKPVVPAADAGERAKVASTVVAEILKLSGIEATANVVEDTEEQIQIEVTGEQCARVIGERGEVLLALQFIVNRIVTRQVEGDQLIILDAAGYRERRRNALVELAERLAQRAERDQKVVKLSPMSPHDRRVFHRALTENEGVRTESKGDGLYRNLLIIPSEYQSARG